MNFPREVLAAATTLTEYYNRPGNTPIVLPPDLQNAMLAQRKGPTPADLMDLWNSRRDKRLPICAKMTGARRGAASQRLKEWPEYDKWLAFMDAINANSWLLGERPSADYPNWKANFDWFIRPGSMVKFMEGGYKKDMQARPESARDNYGDELDERSRWADKGVNNGQ